MIKNLTTTLFLFLLLFLPMILVNEYVRQTSPEKCLTRRGISVINNSEKSLEKCTWACHNYSDYCEVNHVQLVRNYRQYIDPIYFGIIGALKSTGAYALANIIFLVILIPLFLLFLFINVIKMQQEINRLKSSI